MTTIKNRPNCGGNLPKALKRIAIVAGIGIDTGHWITILAKREEGNVSIRVTDSLCQIGSWLFNDHIFSHVLPFYLALTTPEQRWKDFFDDSLNREIFAEYQEENNKDAKRKANIFLCNFGSVY